MKEVISAYLRRKMTELLRVNTVAAAYGKVTALRDVSITSCNRGDRCDPWRQRRRKNDAAQHHLRRASDCRRRYQL